MRFFAINTSGSILYVDNDDKVRLVQNETEFLELWQVILNSFLYILKVMYI